MGCVIPSPLRSALLLCSILYTRHGYPIWRVRNDPTATDSEPKVALLAFSIFASNRHTPDEFDYSVLDALLDQRLFTPKTRTRLISADDSHGISPYNKAVTTDIELSVWQYCLLSDWLLCIYDLEDGQTSRREVNAKFAGTVERYLRHSAGDGERDLTVSLIHRQHPSRLKFTFQFDTDKETCINNDRTICC